ncbi:MAG: endonuclease Q family protein [Halanaerobiales bacterium]|nr:endonuclease Q family protein [Halanaerobiales bacterium]
MNKYYGDLHIHIGAAQNGRPVKITASKNLTFETIIKESKKHKGLDLIGIIDCASPRVQQDMYRMLKRGEIKELDDGGFKYDDMVIIPGAEVESREANGGMVHYLAYFPFFENIKDFTEIMKQYITNINLSSQVTNLTGLEIFKIVKSTGGILIPAHLFTPYKSFYGNAFKSYLEVFTKEVWDQIPAIELGLSADTHLADMLSELKNKTFLSNSDAHSALKIAREYNIFKMNDLSFQEFELTLNNKGDRTVITNYGLDPRLGKYHRSYCDKCEQVIVSEQGLDFCPNCDKKLIKGVKDRILKISDQGVKHPKKRGKYIYQIPLLEIPGIGIKTLDKLLDKFDNEMNVLHNVSYNQLKELLNSDLADKIIKARNGAIRIQSGGGGKYGKMK